MRIKNNYIRNSINIILYCIIIICLIQIGSKLYNYYKDNKAYDTIRELKVEIYDNNNSVDTSIEESNDYIKKMYEELKSVNSDYKFWITIDDTVVDYPVVQRDNNDFYLNHNFYGEKNMSGAIFLDYENNELEDKNLILYGHNMKDGSMFADINKFKEKDFFDNKKIKIITENGQETYEVFSVFVEKASYIDLKNKFNNNEEYIEYINYLKDKSYYSKEVSGDFSNIITLYTCSYEFDDARTIVCAKLIQE